MKMNKNIKILLATNFSEIGGGEKNLFYLAMSLTEFCNVTVYCPKGALSNLLIQSKIPVIEAKFSSKYIPILNIKELRKLSGFDIIHLYSYSLLITFSILSFFNKIVVHHHGPWESFSKKRSRFINLLINKCICITDDIYKLNYLPETKKIIIPLGSPIVSRVENDNKSIKKEEFTLLCIARYQRIKGQDLLIDALKILDKIITTPVRLILIGNLSINNLEDSKYRDEILETIKYNFKNINIQIEDYKTNLSKYYNLADIVVVPSRYESFSMVTIEALTHGRPVVAPNSGGPKFIINSNNIGLLFEAGCCIDLYNKIYEAIINYNVFNKTNCINRGLNFNINNQCRSTVKLYEDLIK